MTELKKERGTSISDLEQRFLIVAEAWEKRTSIKVQLARVFGNRWSYVCGPLPKKDSPQSVKRLRLNATYGLLVYCPEGRSFGEEELKREIERKILK